MSQDNTPVLYSFRRCPYAIRARIGLLMCGQKVELREVLLRSKPAAMIQASAKATVPVMCLPDGTVLDQSLDIMQWALAQCGDRAQLLSADCQPQQQFELIARNDAEFKHWLDRYKYHVRYPEHSLEHYREQATVFLSTLEVQLVDSAYLFGSHPQLADIAIVPFVRQFCAVDREWFALHASSRLNDWLADWLENPVFKDAMVKYPPWQAAQTPVYIQDAAG